MPPRRFASARRFSRSKKPVTWSVDAPTVTTTLALGNGTVLGQTPVNDIDLTLLRTRGMVSVSAPATGQNDFMILGDQSQFDEAVGAVGIRIIDSKAMRKVKSGDVIFSAVQYLQSVSSHEGTIAYAEGVVTEEAVTAGSVPLPMSSGEWDGWYFWTQFRISDPGAAGTLPVVRITALTRRLARVN